MRMQSGPVPTVVDVSVGAWAQRLTFDPNQRQELALPPPTDQSSVVHITTGSKFSPRDRDPQNKDFRRLGIWVEFP